MQHTLCFAHANGFPAGSYRKLFAALADGYTVLAPDKLGHDPRYPVDDNWGNLVDELLAYLEASGRTPLIGVGHSLGGVLTLKAALRRPQLFRAVLILDPPAFMGAAAAAMALAKRLGFIDRVTPAGKSRSRRDHWPSREAALEALRHKPLFRRFDPDCMADYIAAGTEPVADGVRLVYDPLIEAEIFRHIPHTLPWLPQRLQVPGAIVCGRDTDVARPQDMRALARRHGLRLEYLPGGHLFPLEHPLATAARLKALIGELLPAAGSAEGGAPG